MTLTEIYSLIAAATDTYASGGPAWAIQSGVQTAQHYTDIENFTGGGICVYSWIGAGEVQEESDSPLSCEMETMLYARGKYIGDQSLLGFRAAMLTDDLQQMLLSMNNGHSCTVRLHSFEEAILSGNTAEVLVRATCHYIASGQ